MSNERDELNPAGKSGPEWTKEEPGRDGRGFDFSAFLGPSLEEQVTDALDGKDLLDADAYGTFPPGYLPRRGGPGERGRHEAPEPEEPEEPEYPGEPPTQRFTRDGQAAPPPSYGQEQRPEDQTPVIKDAPPPRPKVVVADPKPTPRVYVTPEREYDDEEPGGRSGKGFKIALALLLTVAAILGVAALAVSLFPRNGGDVLPSPQPSPTDYLFGGIPTRAPSVPTAPPTAPPSAAPTDTPQPTPPQIVFYTVSVTAGTGGSISPAGAVQVEEGASVTFAITPDAGYVLSQLLIDGVAIQPAGSFTFADVRQDHVIYAVFQPEATQPPVTTQPPQPTDAPPVTEPPQPPVIPDEPDTPPETETEDGTEDGAE